MTETVETFETTVDLDGHTYLPLDCSDGTIEAPPGRYVVGDPCYGVPRAMWTPFLDAIDSGPGRNDLFAAIIDGHTVIAVAGHCGDNGIDADGREYPSDSGLLGLVPLALMDHEPTDAQQVVDLTGITVCTYDDDQGTVVLGDIRLRTDPDPEPTYCGGCGRASDYEEYCTWGCGYGEDIDDDLDDED